MKNLINSLNAVDRHKKVLLFITCILFIILVSAIIYLSLWISNPQNNIYVNFGNGKSEALSVCPIPFVPAYFNSTTTWNTLTTSLKSGQIIILNPSNGPGTAVNNNILSNVSKSQSSGIKVLGYVNTKFTNKSSNDVKNEIDRYYAFYKVDGIFLDNASDKLSKLSYYQDISAYVRAGSGKYLTLNPGTVPNEGYASIADTIVTFESTFNNYKSATFPTWVFKYPASKFINFIFNAGNAINMNSALNLASQRNVGNIYITDNTSTNLYDTLPTYWNQEINTINSFCKTISQTPPITTILPTKISTTTPITSTSTVTPSIKPTTVTPTATVTPTVTPTPITNATWWKPSSSQPLHFHWQLSDDFVYPRDIVAGATVYDIDGELTSADTVAKLHSLGPNIKVICYFDAGVYETYRSDASSFPSSVIGNSDTGWNGSYWLDIRQTDILLPIMKSRMQNWCKNKGFDAIEPDETEVWSNNPGFPITKDQNNYYNQQIAALAHSLNLSVGLKGNTSEIPDLYTYFDWTLNEQCWQYSECDNVYNYFSLKGKAAFNVEYKTTPNCSVSNAQHMNSMKRDLNLVGPTNNSYLYLPCIPNNQSNW